MKEITPFFHKAMLLNDFGWEPLGTSFLAQIVNNAATPSVIAPEFSSPNSEMKWTSLQLTCLTKDANFPEENASTLEIHSPNRKNSILLRVSTKSVDRWSAAISAAIDQVCYRNSCLKVHFHYFCITAQVRLLLEKYAILFYLRQWLNVLQLHHQFCHFEFKKWDGPFNC